MGDMAQAHHIGIIRQQCSALCQNEPCMRGALPDLNEHALLKIHTCRRLHCKQASPPVWWLHAEKQRPIAVVLHDVQAYPCSMHCWRIQCAAQVRSSVLLPSCPALKPLHAAPVFLDSSLHNSLACEQVPMLLKPLSAWLQTAYIVRNPATPCLPAWIVSIKACCKPVSRIHQKPRGPAVALQKSSRYVKGMDSTPAS